MNRTLSYFLVNLIFITAVVVGSAINGTHGVHPWYLILLFALCSSPIIDAHALNGPYALLVLFSFDFFVMYGALDFRNVIIGDVDRPDVTAPGQTMTELLILAGAAAIQITYRLACRLVSKAPSKAPPKDWSEGTLVVVGVLLWIVCTRLTWEYTVHIVVAPTSEAFKRGVGTLSGIQVVIFLIARMAQPVSILILAYAQCRYRRAYMLPVVVVLVLYQLFFGFVIDFKTEALIGGVLVVLTNLLVNARIPKGWVALMLVVVAVAFPLLQANRTVRAERGQTSTDVSENLLSVFQRSLAAKEKVNSGKERAETPLERLTLKGSVQLLVTETGTVAPFQNGYTLSPLITAFVPRLIWPSKPSVETGRILNREFHLSESADTYISPSHLGELYWNFGWPGVVVGMSMIGLLLGALGGKFNLAEAATLTRVLVVVVSVRFLILAAEGELATQYVSWMRSMLGIGILHLMFARIPWIKLSSNSDTINAKSMDVSRTPRSPFPNLLR